MSKIRFLNTRFWSDDWSSNLDPIEKLLFIYLLENDRTELSGIYELPLKSMSTDTGIEKEMIAKILSRFETDNKAKYHKGWICVLNFTKYQPMDNPKIQMGIKRSLSEVSPEILNVFKDFGYPTDTLPIPYQYPSGNSNLNFNSNLTDNSDASLKKKTKEPPHDVAKIVDYFFSIQGFVAPRGPSYVRHLKASKDLLTCADGNFEVAKNALDSALNYYTEKKLSWTIDTVIKNFHLFKESQKKEWDEV